MKIEVGSVVGPFYDGVSLYARGAASEDEARRIMKRLTDGEGFPVSAKMCERSRDGACGEGVGCWGARMSDEAKAAGGWGVCARGYGDFDAAHAAAARASE